MGGKACQGSASCLRAQPKSNHDAPAPTPRPHATQTNTTLHSSPPPILHTKLSSTTINTYCASRTHRAHPNTTNSKHTLIQDMQRIQHEKYSHTWYYTTHTAHTQRIPYIVITPGDNVAHPLGRISDPVPSKICLNPLEPRSRFGDKPLKFQVACPQNGTAALKGVKGQTQRKCWLWNRLRQESCVDAPLVVLSTPSPLPRNPAHGNRPRGCVILPP